LKRGVVRRAADPPQAPLLQVIEELKTEVSPIKEQQGGFRESCQHQAHRLLGVSPALFEDLDVHPLLQTHIKERADAPSQEAISYRPQLAQPRQPASHLIQTALV